MIGGEPAISARGLERRFGRMTALGGVSFEVAAGDRLALLGANGAGKTTLLRIFARLLRQSAGSVRIFGLDPQAAPVSVLSSLGFLSHETGLYLDLDPLENLVFTARLHGLERAVEVANAALAEVGVERSRRPIRVLSRGQQQRVALARAMLHRPRLLLLDEPWTGLDREAQAVLDTRLDSHQRDGGTSVFTTHDIRHGLAIATHVAVLRRGTLAFMGPARDAETHRLEAVMSGVV